MGRKPPRDVKILEPFWYVSKGAAKGGHAVYAKYGKVGGDPRVREEKWREWWNKKGRLQKQPILQKKPIKIPAYSIKLAEFAGIMMGDGGTTKRFIHITLNSESDAEYSKFVAGLIRGLFGVDPTIHARRDSKALKIQVSRTALAEFCRSIGLKVGNKLTQGLDIPGWIMDKGTFQKACLRGLFDTDGCTVVHRYKVKGKEYVYKKWSFSSASPPLMRSVIEILRGFDFRPRMEHNGRQVWLDAQTEVARYFRVVGTSNPKHLRRFRGEVAEPG
jgi:hypothetical protein